MSACLFGGGYHSQLCSDFTLPLMMGLRKNIKGAGDCNQDQGVKEHTLSAVLSLKLQFFNLFHLADQHLSYPVIQVPAVIAKEVRQWFQPFSIAHYYWSYMGGSVLKYLKLEKS